MKKYPQILMETPLDTNPDMKISEYLKLIEAGDIENKDRLRAFADLMDGGQITEAMRDTTQGGEAIEAEVQIIKLKIFALLDHDQALEVWLHLLKEHTREAILAICGESDRPHDLAEDLQSLVTDDALSEVLEKQFPQEAVWKGFSGARSPRAEHNYTRGFISSSMSSSKERGLAQGNIKRFFPTN